MAEKKPNALTKKRGPLPTWGYVAAAGAGVVLFLWWRNRQAAAAAANAGASIPLTGGTTIPGGTSGAAGGGTSSTPSGPSTLAQWEEQAIALMTSPTYSATQAYNDLSQWLSGQPVSTAGYSALGGVISQLGLPPGIGSTGPITVASSSSTGAPGGVPFGSGELFPTGPPTGYSYIPGTDWPKASAFLQSGGVLWTFDPKTGNPTPVTQGNLGTFSGGLPLYAGAGTGFTP